MISSKGKSKMSECFQRQSRKNFEFCSYKNCTLTRAKETEELKGRILELETRNVLLEAKVRDSAMINCLHH